jgi:replicative DNA helicase
LFRPSLTAEQIVSQAEELILSVGERARTGGEDVQSLLPSLTKAIADLQFRYENPGSLRGVPTGLRDLDAKTLGLRDGSLIVVAGHPGMGKRALGQGFVGAVLEQTKKCVLVFSLEMSSEDWTGRLLCSRARIDANRFQTGQLEDDEWAKITAATAEIADWKDRLFFSYEASISPYVVRSRARRLTRKHDVGLIVIDYLQLMAEPGYASENRATEVASISRQLKGMAKELRVPVVALSQLDRGVESRMDKRPNLSDLRESGAIEEDADIVMLLYRDEYYNRDSEARGLAEIILAKQRNGEAGAVKVRFNDAQCRFADL